MALQMKCLTNMNCMCFVPHKFTSFFKMAVSKKQKRLLTASDWSWEKDFPIGPALQSKHVFYCHPCQKVISCRHMGRGQNWRDLNSSLLVKAISLIIHYLFLWKKPLDWTMKVIAANQNRHSWMLLFYF